jgi:hypothetical protein
VGRIRIGKGLLNELDFVLFDHGWWMGFQFPVPLGIEISRLIYVFQFP